MPSNELEGQNVHECDSNESHTDSYSCQNLISSGGLVVEVGVGVAVGVGVEVGVEVDAVERKHIT